MTVSFLWNILSLLGIELEFAGCIKKFLVEGSIPKIILKLWHLS